mmetsp:Transcript_53560/g.135966  ORF Transcript_53560/g.135966 Transcript_53560/m.135966 type:complete len:150 (-) Transcript_53560:64-513(-)
MAATIQLRSVLVLCVVLSAWLVQALGVQTKTATASSGTDRGAALRAAEPSSVAAQAAGALEQRRQASPKVTASLLSLEASTSFKRDSAYAVRAAGTAYEPPPKAIPRPAGEANWSPPTPVDQTVALPPDVDGNPYNAPVWTENKAPASL